MPRPDTNTADMGARHETYVNKLFGFTPSRGSGNQDRSPLDGRHNAGEVHYAFGHDSKSTLGKSLSVSITAWEKLVRQAHGLRPMMPLRFYQGTALTYTTLDLAVVDINDLNEVWEAAETYRELRT